MLSITYRNEKYLAGTASTIEWYIGNPDPLIYDGARDVIEIQADDDELEHIKNMFPKVNNSFGSVVSPLIPKGKVVRLFGDLAKTIVANLNNT
jgi:hypothetical protein